MNSNAKNSTNSSGSCRNFCTSGDTTPDFTTDSIGIQYQFEQAGHANLGKVSDYDNSNSIGTYYDYFSTNYGIAFFIRERKKHYSNLNTSVFKPLSNISNNDVRMENRGLFSQLTYHIYIPIDSSHYTNALLHIQKEKSKKDLPSKMNALASEITTHNKKVESLQELINRTIVEAFKKPTTESYKYHFDNVRDKAMSIWAQSVLSQDTSDINMTIIQNRVENRMEELKLKEENGILRSNEIYVGEGSSEDVENIRSGLKHTIENDSILQSLLEIMQSKKAINDKLECIARPAHEISQAIENETYRIKAKCCPTFWSLVEQYMLS
jgi:hypothetical protein